MSAPKKAPDVDNVFTQLTAGLMLLARAKGDQPMPQYFVTQTTNVRRLVLDGGNYQVVLTQVDDEPKKAPGT